VGLSLKSGLKTQTYVGRLVKRKVSETRTDKPLLKPIAPKKQSPNSHERTEKIAPFVLQQKTNEKEEQAKLRGSEGL
jgi:hypothetical protein